MGKVFCWAVQCKVVCSFSDSQYPDRSIARSSRWQVLISVNRLDFVHCSVLLVMVLL